MPNPRMAEKDYLECAILDKLFQDSYINDNFVFAGGGSITKSYNISPRICQDLDLSCADFVDIPNDRSKKQLYNFKKDFKKFVFEVLKAKINYIINQNQQFMIATDRDWHALENKEQFMSSPTLHLLYKSAFGPEMGHICIEVIPRVYQPYAIEHRSVVPYSTKTPMGDIPTVSYEQTFWDKIYALHSNTQSEKPHSTQFYSRHYYDVAQIAPYVDLYKTKHMLRVIANHQKKYTTREISPFIGPRDISLIPDNETANKLDNDYQEMARATFYSAPEEWSTIMQRLRMLNQKLKTL